MTEQPTAEQPTAEQPMTEQPTAEQPTAEQPITEHLRAEPLSWEAGPPTVELLEPRPFVTGYADAWPTPMRLGRRSRTAWTAPKARGKPVKEPRRRTGLALAALIGLSLLAMFFAWVTAEPLWLAVGHADEGTVTITGCTGQGVGHRCVGAFTTADGAFTVERVATLGLAPEQRRAGATGPARMVTADRCGDTPVGCRAYAANHPGLRLRWALGLLLVLLCGLGIAWATGATRVERSRLAAVAACVGGPFLLAIGFLAATW